METRERQGLNLPRDPRKGPARDGPLAQQQQWPGPPSEMEPRRLDILVNNAGFQMEEQDFTKLSAEQIEQTFKTKIFATMWMSQVALRTSRPGASSSTRGM